MRFLQASDGASRAEVMFHAHRFLLRAGLAIGNVFAWIFVFEYFSLLTGSVPRALLGTLIMYALSQGITILATPLGAAFLRQGTRRMHLWSLVLVASAYVVLGGTLGGFFNEAPTAWGIAMFAILLGFYRALYFIPYRLNRAEVDHVRGERTLYEVLLALFPAFAGATLVLEAYAPLKLLFGAALFAGVSILPAFSLPDIRECFSYHYFETFGQLFNRRNREMVWASFFDGMQGAALFLVWPLAVFLIVGFSYMTLGIVFSATLLLLLLFRVFYRRFGGLKLSTYSAPVQIVFAVSGWVARLAAGTPLSVVVADFYAYSVPSQRGTLTDPFVFEQAADNGSFIDEQTALKEIALAGGRKAFVIVVGGFVSSTPLIFAFGAALLIAALAAGISAFLAHHIHSPAY